MQLGVCRAFVVTVELGQQINTWGKQTNPLQRDWTSWRETVKKERRVSSE